MTTPTMIPNVFDRCYDYYFIPLLYVSNVCSTQKHKVHPVVKQTALGSLPQASWSVIMCEPMALVVDDDADLYAAWNDTRTTAKPSQNWYPTHKLGILVQKELLGHLRVGLPEHGGPQVKHVPRDGNCANESLRRGYIQLTRANNNPPPAYDADQSCHAGVRELKEQSFRKLLDFAVPGWACTDINRTTSTTPPPVELSDEAISRLQTFGRVWFLDLMQDARRRGFGGKTQQSGNILVKCSMMTVTWLREALDDLAKKNDRWVGIPYFAAAAAALGCNIVLWEFDGDEHLVPYWDNSKFKINHSGMFLVSPEAGYIHLVYCAFSDWHRDGVGVDNLRWTKRTCGGSPRLNHFEYVAESECMETIEQNLNAIMGKYPSEVFAARAVVSRILPPPTSRRGQPECGRDSGAVGKGKGRACESQTKTCNAIVESPGREYNARPRPGTLRCGRHMLPVESSELPEGSDVDDNVDVECYVGASDLLGPGSATTKFTSPARYLTDLTLLDSRYHKAFRNLWRMTVGKLGKTFTAENVINGKSAGDTLPWWEGSDTEDFEWTSAGVPDDREEHGARILSQKPFPDRPKKKKKKKRKRKRAGYDASWSDEDVDGEGDKEDEDESEVGSDGGGEEEEEHENGAGGSSNDEEKRGERYGAFEIATETANELPKLCLADLPLLLPPKKRGGPGGIGKLAKRFWDCTFPLAAIQLVVEKTNENATRRQAEVAKRFEEEKAAVALRKEEVDVSRGRDEEEKDSRKEGGETKEENDQAGRGGGDGDFDKADEEGPEAEDYDAETEVLENKEKKALMDCLSHGRAKWPDAGITTSHMYAVIGLVILMGLQPLAEIRCHWDTRPMYDFPHVRECMTRNFFLLIYCRYIHMASKQSGTPGEDGYDILHHIRGLESILNTAWSTCCRPGRWISFDEQMVVNKGRFGKVVQRHLPNKTIKHGIKIWAACCWTGYCFVGYTDGGFAGDPRLKPFAKNPLGRRCCVVLFVLFDACQAFGCQLKDSGIMLACNIFFTSPILFLCLAAWGVFAVGSLRSNLRGAAEAKAWLRENSDEVNNKGLRTNSQMVFARMGDMAFTLWKDSKEVFFVSTIHIYEKHFKRLKYTRRQSKGKGEGKFKGQQPPCLKDCSIRMKGADKADQYNSLYAFPHRVCWYFWRRVFEQKIQQSITNAWLMFVAWRETLDFSGVVITDSDRDVVRAELAERASVGVGKVDADGVDKEIRARFETAVKYLCKVNRRRWTEDLCVHLMSFCREGSAPPSRKTATVETGNGDEKNDGGGSREGDVGAKSGPQLHAIQTRRRCSNPNCQPTSHRAKDGSKATTFEACRCLLCGSEGVPMCKTCFSTSHDEIATAVNSRRTKAGAKSQRKKVFWA